MDELKNILKPLIRTATRLNLERSAEPKDSYLKSQFGGQPYFEIGELWPQSKNGKNLDFVFQVFNTDGIGLPTNIKLVQFYYDFEDFPWDTETDGWLVKIYDKIDLEKVTVISKPQELTATNYCDISYEKVMSLPDWEGINEYDEQAADICCELNDDEPWEYYDNAVKELIGEQDYRSQLGGYPKWVQGESTPKNNKGENMKLLFQIDSEDNAGLMWGDVGLIYVFYDEKTKQIEFILQCH